MDEIPELTPIDESAVAPPPPIQRRQAAGPNVLPSARGLVRFIYTHNPFYVISSVLVFAGLWRSFGEAPEMFEAGAMTLGLASFALVLAVTAVLVIRYGKVWDDARSLLLLIVLMFLGISVTADPVLNAPGQPGAWFMLGGLLLSVSLTEAVLRSVRLRLPMLYRGPYYLVLALFFLYPLAVSPLLPEPPGPRLYWALFAFSPLGGLIFLTLLPAVRRGAAYVADNGSPWRWPLFPWVLFGMLGLCVCLRAYYVCVSFHPILGTQSIFGLYFLAPFLLAVCALLLEGGVVSGRRGLAQFSMAAPMLLPILSMVGDRSNPLFLDFVNVIGQTLGSSPPFLALAAVAAFYLYAVARGAAGAWTWFSAAAAATSVLGPTTVDLSGPWQLAPLPLLVAALPQAWIGLKRRQSWRLTSAAGLMVAASSLALTGTWYTSWHGALPVHLMLVSVLVIAAAIDDAVAPWLRLAGAGFLVLACVTAATGDGWFAGQAPAAVVYFYPLGLIAVALVYGYYIDTAPYFGAAAIGASAWMIAALHDLYLFLQQYVLGLTELAWGAACFLVAAIISLLKTGVVQRWSARRGSEQMSTVPHNPP